MTVGTLKVYNNVDMIANGTTPLYVAPPVSDSQSFYYELGVTAAASVVNLVRQGAQGATIVGTPTYEAGDAVLGDGNYVQTPHLDTASFSWLVIANSTDTFAGSANEPTFMGTYSGRAAGTAIDSSPNGTLPQAAISGLIVQEAVSGGAFSILQSLRITTNITQFKALALTFDAPSGDLTFYNLTDGTSQQVVLTSSYTRPLSTSPIRIGQGYSTLTGECRVAMAAGYTRALLATELTQKMYPFLKLRAGKRGITC